MNTKTSLYHQNRQLYFLSLLSVCSILVGLFYGYNVSQMVTTQKENIFLKKQIDSLKYEKHKKIN